MSLLLPLCLLLYLSLCRVRGDVCLSHSLSFPPLPLPRPRPYVSPIVSMSLSRPLPLCPRILCLSHGPMSLLLRICISLCRVRGRCMSLLSPRGAILGDLIWTIVCQKRPYIRVYVCVKGDLICVYVCVHILFFRYGTQIAAPGVFTPTAPSTSETRWWKGERKNAFEHFMVYCNPNSVLNIFKKKKQL